VVQRRSIGPFSVAPVGLGAMRLTGPNVFGPPNDRHAAIRVLRAALAGGVNHIDTAQFYGPDVVNELIREALHPYPTDLVIVSKVGARRDERGRVLVDDEPQQLRRAIEANLRTLAVDALPVVNLRLMRENEPDAFFDDQLAALIEARDEGLIGAVGLSNITLAHLGRAVPTTAIACVQNFFHLADRASQPVLDECSKQGIAFVAVGSLGFGANGPRSVVDQQIVVEEAARLRCTPAQLALAWALALAPNVLVIPGVSSVDHLRENLKASDVAVDDEAMRRLSGL
jgi:pyridoxine 4-dehydrogenase